MGNYRKLYPKSNMHDITMVIPKMKTPHQSGIFMSVGKSFILRILSGWINSLHANEYLAHQ